MPMYMNIIGPVLTYEYVQQTQLLEATINTSLTCNCNYHNEHNWTNAVKNMQLHNETMSSVTSLIITMTVTTY